jgi:hypothetical protein
MLIVRRTVGVLLVAGVLLAIGASSASAQATRTWVSGINGVGDDANPCSRSAPCKTFAGAISKTADGGEIDALDPAGYGAVTVTKTMTIDGGGTLASILNSLTTGILVNAPGKDVVARNLSINGGSACGGNVGITGVRVLAARSVTLQNLDIQQQGSTPTGAGVLVAPSAGAVQVTLDNVRIHHNCHSGLDVLPTGGAPAQVFVRNSSFAQNAVGIQAGPGAKVSVVDSSLFFNPLALQLTGGGVIDDLGGNTLEGNGSDGAFSNAAAPPPPTPVTTTVTTTVTTPAPAPPPAVTMTVTTPAPKPALVCAVPDLKGLTLSKAKTALRTGHCALGTVTKKKATRAKFGRVLSQTTRAGTQATSGAKVALTLGKK